MADVVFIALAVGLFGVAAAYVEACRHLTRDADVEGSSRDRR